MGRRNFSKEYKLQTTRQVIKEGKRITEVSESLGITEQTIYRWLREYDKYGEEAFKGFGNVRVDSEYKIKLLEKKNKQLLKENEILKKFQVFQKGRQKKKGYTAHSFRHSFATRLTEKNVNILLVQRLLGHLSLDSTKIYVHFENENFRNAIDFI